MEWISAVTRDDASELCVEVQDAAGVRAQAQLRDVGAAIGLPMQGRRNVTIALHHLQVARPDEYLAGIGMSHLDSGGQVVYRADTESGMLLIPAQLLVISVIGNHQVLREALMRPCPPSICSTPILKDDKMVMSPVYESSMSARARQKKTPQKLEWILSYPSAYAAWASVYRHALSGRLNMDMPRATVKFVMWARREGGKSFVTKLRAQELKPDEQPFDFAEEQALTEFVFMPRQDGRPFPAAFPDPSDDPRLRANDALLSMSDEQWAGMEPVLLRLFPTKPNNSGGQRRHSLRTLIDVILLKLGKPYSWSRVPVEKELSRSASVLLSKLQRAGVWDRLVEAYCGGSDDSADA